jgi:hypothetical protein
MQINVIGSRLSVATISETFEIDLAGCQPIAAHVITLIAHLTPTPQG